MTQNKIPEWKPTAIPPVLAIGASMIRPFYNRPGKATYFEAYIPEHPAAKARAGWVALHRVVLENRIGPYLEKGERTYFRNGNGFDLSIGNIQVYEDRFAKYPYPIFPRAGKWMDGKI